MAGIFNNSQNVRVSGGNFHLTQLKCDAGIDMLRQQAVPAAMHDSGEVFNRPKCHENTRTAVLERLMDWIVAECDEEDDLVMWLYGDAGAGKSTIAQTLAERCFSNGKLLATFFFSRTDPRRSTHTSLATTIAYQVATNIPELKGHVDSIIERDPLILQKSLETQVQNLIVLPINSLDWDKSASYPYLIIIDGLDECAQDENQARILRILVDAAKASNSRLKVLISSRAESQIKAAFSSPSIATHVVRLALDHTFLPDDDIRHFLGSVFRDITRTHPLSGYLPSPWPSAEVIERLVRKASGQFIYAATVSKYISSLRHNPMDRLEVILGLHPKKADKDLPFAQLDALYIHILYAILAEDVEMVLLILSIFVVGQGLTLLEEISIFLSIHPESVELLLSPLASIMLIGEGHQPGRVVHMTHASFGDFLLDRRRSKQFCVEQAEILEQLIHLCTKQVNVEENSKAAWNCRLHAFTTLSWALPRVELTGNIQDYLLGFSLKKSLELTLYSDTSFKEVIRLAEVFTDEVMKQKATDLRRKTAEDLEYSLRFLLNRCTPNLSSRVIPFLEVLYQFSRLEFNPQSDGDAEASPAPVILHITFEKPLDEEDPSLKAHIHGRLYGSSKPTELVRLPDPLENPHKTVSYSTLMFCFGPMDESRKAWSTRSLTSSVDSADIVRHTNLSISRMVKI